MVAQVSSRTDTSARIDAARWSSDTSAGGGVHVVQRGETLSGIAHRFGVDAASLARINSIRNPDLIHVGQRLSLPEGATQSYAVAQGDTLRAIAKRHGIDTDTLIAANPQLTNPNRIYPGDRLSIPAAGPAEVGASAAVGGTTRVEGNTLRLSAQDVIDIKKTLQTEWVQTAGDAQAHGIVDTILNRTASGHWGSTVADTVNAYNQFSDINGPVARRDQRNSVDDIPDSRISARVDRLVDTYLAARAAGQESSIGSHLNYANPHFSDARNLRWINALDGPVLGRGNAVHHHGTVPELQRYRPENLSIALPGSGETSPTPEGSTSGTIDGRAAARANGVTVKSDAVAIGSLHASMEPAIRAVAQEAARLGLPTPVITSGNDSRHSNGSLHYSDRALDFRGNNISVAQGNALRDAVKQRLGADYDVLFETFLNTSNNHLHVEFDPR